MSGSPSPRTRFGRATQRAVRRATVAVALAFVALAGYLRVQGYHRAVDLAERITLEHLTAVAYAAAGQLDGDAHARLTARVGGRDGVAASADDADYLALHRELARVHDDLKVATPIYTYVRDGHGGLAFAVTSAERPYFRHDFHTARPCQRETYGVAGTLPPYDDDMGTWLSAYAPLRASDGRVVAMVQADERFDRFIAEAREQAFAGVGWDLAILASLFALVARFVGHLLERERDDKEALATAAEEQARLVGELEAREGELAAKTRELERSNRELTDFANVASHDLKSPLRGIRNFSQLLARRHRDDLGERGGEYLDFILGNADRALDLVDGLLAYAKTGGGNREETDFALADAARDAVANLDAAVRERGASVDIGELPPARADRMLVTQVLQNLIGNGLKYNRSERPRVRVWADRDADGAWVVRVRDNGIGIPAEHREAVFEMFRRLHGAGGEFEGSGIGLASCVRAVQRHGGRMWCESEEGAGSTFSFTLPGALAAEPVFAEA